MTLAGLCASVTIDSVSVECLVDAGATLSVISSKLWYALEPEYVLTKFKTPIVSASENSIGVKGCTELVIKYGDIKCRTSVIVADLVTDVVLGIDFMKTNQVSINATDDDTANQTETVNLLCGGKVGC